MTKKQKSRNKKYLLEQLSGVAKDLRLAQRRVEMVGISRWLFNFACSDLGGLSAGQLLDFGFDILALVMPKDLKTMDEGELLGAFNMTRGFFLPESDDFNRLVQLGDEVKGGKVSDTDAVKIHDEIVLAAQHVPSWMIFEFHKALRAKFDAFFGRSEHPWKHERPAEVKWLMARGVRTDGPSTAYAESYENPAALLQPVDRLLLIAGEAVLKDQGKFSVCPRCKNPFMAKKKTLKKHCSEACAIYLRVNRYRKKKTAA